MEFRDGEWIHLFPFGERPDIPEDEYGRRLFLVNLSEVELPQGVPISGKAAKYKLCMMTHIGDAWHWAALKIKAKENIADAILLLQDYEAPDILGEWLWMLIEYKAPETVPWEVFYKRCQWFCGKTEDEEPTPDSDYVLVHCGHKDNPEDVEGNCNEMDCPIYEKFSKE